jgi:hypothetical protein
LSRLRFIRTVGDDHEPRQFSRDRRVKRFLRVMSHSPPDQPHQPIEFLARNRMFSLSAVMLNIHLFIFISPPVGMYGECAVSSLCRRECDRSVFRDFDWQDEFE